MGCVNSYYCYMAVSSYITRLDDLKAKMLKNYQQMDLSNAVIQSDIEDVVNEMMTYCDTLKTSISGYYFE